LDGTSLKPLLLDDKPEWNDRVLFNHWGKSTSARSQKYRLDADNKLFDMENDPGQTTDISSEQHEIARQLLLKKENWEQEVLTELPEKDERPFVIGHPDYTFTQIPARDGVPLGNIIRSNKHPNCSYLTNWINLDDKIIWEAEVLADGDFEVEIYYTCPAEAIGSVIQLSFGEAQLTTKVSEPHDPPLTGMENDRSPRIESYVKDFKPLKMGTIHLSKGKGTLMLKALDIPGSQVMDFRLLMLTKIDN
jgi:hypothetical protein